MAHRINNSTGQQTMPISNSLISCTSSSTGLSLPLGLTICHWEAKSYNRLLPISFTYKRCTVPHSKGIRSPSQIAFLRHITGSQFLSFNHSCSTSIKSALPTIHNILAKLSRDRLSRELSKNAMMEGRQTIKWGLGAPRICKPAALVPIFKTSIINAELAK